MMPEQSITRGRPGPAHPGAWSTHRPRPAHMTRGPVHTTHTAVPGVPGSASPGVYTRPGSAPAVHTAPVLTHTAPDPGAASVHTQPVEVHTLVWATRHLVHTGRVLVSGGVYTGPASVVPPVVAAVTWGAPVAGHWPQPCDLRVRAGVVA